VSASLWIAPTMTAVRTLHRLVRDLSQIGNIIMLPRCG
jgi:hypothetical protein